MLVRCDPNRGPVEIRTNGGHFMNNLKWISLSLSYLLISSTAMAFSFSHLQGESRREYRSPQGLAELCVIPKKLPGGLYKNGDIEKENELCSYDFYTNMGICPKYSSTNPAILLLKPNAKYSKPAIDASDCNVEKMDVKTEAKFKQSITCSHTPSILAYYQVSRLLGNVGRVPVAVIRTMDMRTHGKLVKKANDFLAGIDDPIRASWRRFAEYYRAPRLYPLVFDGTQSQIYGALSDNVKNEEKYTEVSGVGDYDSRYQRFVRQRPFQLVASSQSVPQIVGSSAFTAVAQTVLQMKDVSDMVVLDTLLNQQDRIGNIHYKFYWYFINPQTGKLERSKSDAKLSNGDIKVPEDESKNMAGKSAVLLKEMVLKDNDCGVAKTNMMRQVSALEKIRHMSYQTYRRFIDFEKTLTAPATKDYFMIEMLFSPDDYKDMVKNAAFIKQVLTAKCQSGELKFDVDIENYIPGATQPPRSCL